MHLSINNSSGGAELRSLSVISSSSQYAPNHSSAEHVGRQ